MKVFTVTAPKKFAFVDIDIPEMDEYEVLVKHEGCLICNCTDWKIINRLFATKEYPVALGHESFGKVVKVGAKVKNFQLGDRVICSNAIPKGYSGTYYSTWGAFSEYGIAGDYDALIEDGQSVDGEFSYRKRYSANYKIDNTLPIEQAGVVFPLAETASSIMQTPEMKGKDVAVFGTGFAGYTLALFAQKLGAKSVTVFGRRQKRIALAKELGIENAVLSDEAYTENKKYDVIFEATGQHDVFARGIPFLNENGYIIIHGAYVAPYQFNLSATPMQYHIRTINPNVGESLGYVQNLIRKGELPIEKLLTHVWDFSQMETALKQVENGEVVKGLVKIQAE